MLDWQGKKWVKVIAVTVVIAFLSYDIAWAMDFSPLVSARPAGSAAPQAQSKIQGLISKIIPKKTHIEETPEETEISFKSQLVPRKKYGEGSGFLRLESVKDMIRRQMNDMERRRQIEEDRINRKITDYNINTGLYIDAAEKAQEAQAITEQVMKARGNTMGAAAAAGEFNYVLNKDGSRINYIDGLPSSIQNEKVVDAWGQTSIKNTWNMEYNDDKLLVSYDAEIIDPVGNVTGIHWYDAVYSPDSSSWGNKFILSYKETITDPYGSVATREWLTTREGYDSAGKISTYNEIMKDALGNIISSLDWTNGQYEDNRVKSYHQTTTDAYGNVSELDWEGTYNQHTFITGAFSKETQTNRDGSTSYSENAVTYTYEDDSVLQSAAGSGIFTAEDKFGNVNSGATTQEYEMMNGQVKLVRNISVIDYENIDGSTAHSESTVTYSYNDTNLLIGAIGVTLTDGTDVFGSGYNTVTTDTYDVIAGQTRRVRSISLNEAEDIFGSINTSETVNDYVYDEITGTLVSATGYTDTIGEDVFGNQSVTHTEHTYQIINGQPRLVRSETRGNLVNPMSELGQTIAEIQDFLESYAGLATPAEREAKLQEVGLQGLDLNLIDLTTVGVLRIVGWLWRASTRLINCAIESLYNIISGIGASVTKKELLEKAILIEVLTGIINPETVTGELMLSMYSMVKAAQAKGITLQGANVTIDQLRSIGQPVIAHVGGDHYIVIRSVSDSTVTYLERDTEATITISEFLTIWQGDIVTPVVPGGVNAFNLEELKDIKGADKPPSPSDPPNGWTPTLPTNPPSGYPAGGTWTDTSSWAWNDGTNQWEWRERYHYEVKVGGDIWRHTQDESGNGTEGFIKEDVSLANGTYRHVKQWSEDGGFELWRKLGDVEFDEKDISYRTWGDGSQSWTRVEGLGNGTQKIGIHSIGEHSEQVIDAINVDARGVLEANYWTHSEMHETEEGETNYGGETIARIVRAKFTGDIPTIPEITDDDYYSIDGLRYMYDGLVASSISVKRQIGRDSTDRNMQIYRTDLTYGDSSEWVNPYAGGRTIHTFTEDGAEIKVHITYDPYGFGIPFAATYEIKKNGKTDTVTVILGEWKTGTIDGKEDVFYFDIFDSPDVVQYNGQDLGDYFPFAGDAEPLNSELKKTAFSNAQYTYRNKWGNWTTATADNYIQSWSITYDTEATSRKGALNLVIRRDQLTSHRSSIINKHATFNRYDWDNWVYGTDIHKVELDGEAWWVQRVRWEEGSDDLSTPENETVHQWQIYRDLNGDEEPGGSGEHWE
jgi:hypothetical protein